MSVKLLTEHHWEFLSLTGGCIGWSEFTLVKIPHYGKSHVTAHMGVGFKCATCGKNFATRYQVERHKRQHGKVLKSNKRYPLSG